MYSGGVRNVVLLTSIEILFICSSIFSYYYHWVTVYLVSWNMLIMQVVLIEMTNTNELE